MRYYKLDSKAVVSEIFDDDLPAIFKNFPIEKRMPPEEFAKLIPITDADIGIGVGMTKNEDGEWVTYVETVDENPDQPISDIGETQKTYAERLAELEAENEMMADVLDSLLMDM